MSCESDGDEDSCTDLWLGLLKAQTAGNAPTTPTWKSAPIVLCIHTFTLIDTHREKRIYQLSPWFLPKDDFAWFFPK